MRKRHIAFHSGQTYRVQSLGGNQGIADRLAQMGILPGMEITIVRIGPMGNPFELATDNGQSIALRNTEVEALDCKLVSLPLIATFPDTQQYRISAINGNPRQQRKLTDVGLRPGIVIRVEATRPYELRIIDEDRLVRLAQAEAQYLMLQPLEPDA
jgi:Fe2+ transport system protein FeoA